MDTACDSHHKIKLASFCRRCGNVFEFNTETSRHKPKPASEFTKELFAVDNLDVSCDVETKHPPFLGRCCVMKLDSDRRSRNRNDSKIKSPANKGNCYVFSFHEFYVEKEGACPICNLQYF